MIDSPATIRRYTVDLEAGTISFVLDTDTGETQTHRLDDIVETLMWLKSRERDLRRMVFDFAPPDNYGYQRMHLVNGFYVGTAVEHLKGMGGTRGQTRLHSVKVTAQVFEGELRKIQESISNAWAERINERKSSGYVPIWNADGKVLNEEDRAPVLPEHAPPMLYQEHQARVWMPGYWQARYENLDRNKPVKLP